MASSSRTKHSVEDEARDEEEEELEGFDDFTIASSWERFISEIEAICRQWQADGPKNLLEKGAIQLEFLQNLYVAKFELKFATKSYNIEYYFETGSKGKPADWNSALHDLQLCFGVREFLVIAPQSASGVVLDAPEACKLLSAIAIALSNCSSLWPAFVPVHDPSREAYIGIQNMGTVFTRRFETDRIGSQVPVKLMHLEGLYELFLSKFAYSMLDLQIHHLKVHFTMESTYLTVPYYDENDDLQVLNDESKEYVGNFGGDTHNKSQWDDDCPWSEWYSLEDPIKGFELTAMWSEKVVENALEMAELENTSPHEAEKWMILPILSPNLSEGKRVGFSSQLALLVTALDMSFNAQFMEDFVSVDNPTSDNLKSSMVVPPPTVLDRVFKDLFHDGSQVLDFTKSEHKRSRAIKGAPLDSLFARFCLHSLWVGNCNIRAIAVLWIEFIREVRWCWEESQPLPKMLPNGSIDLSTCLINQKLQMLAICIEKKIELNEEFQDCIGSNDHTDSQTKEGGVARDVTTDSQVLGEESYVIGDSPVMQDDSRSQKMVSRSSSKPGHVVSPNLSSQDHGRRGSSGVVGSMMLLKSYQSMHAPFTQEPPLMTEDMHEERLQAVEAFGDSFNFSAQLERDILSSDMSAFKAANPDAVFEDFIRWHSPGDWENNEIEESGSSKGSTRRGLKDNWPPRGQLSKRMSEHGNLWRKIWNDALALPAYEQKPLLDPNREGEKYFPRSLRSNSYICVTANRISGGSETIDDLKRLCVTFKHVEDLVSLAASLHRKFTQAPRLSELLFTDCYNFYLPRMGIGSEEASQREFDMKQQVRMNERQAVSNLFPQPTANQSWRKVLSMGNLLNGHEPTIREIIFSIRDNFPNNHYAARIPVGSQREMESYRMYIRGTSNDLRVALSVTSCD
ncbi:hypothetical protein K2173_007670 [Erythroxylum novogranatense]|uniref:Rab3 GTPase-activating protein catalytic subunit n=1 Tax=Erythroxylum novogranatense TaxID=1862640 RepID=A0AAV8TS68_9ROSI|nr:hypothetical protein K2173_007670 [Erythroxylum novogranatense]